MSFRKQVLNPTGYYEADVIPLNTSGKFYIVSSDTPFKERYNNHNIFGAWKKVV